MSCNIRLATPLRRHANGLSYVQVPNGSENATVATALQHLSARYPGIGARLYDAQGQVKTHLHIFLNNEDIHALNGLETHIRDGDTVVLLPALTRE